MEIKQVIVIRKDLNMRKGKMVAQGCHASTQVCIQLESEWDNDWGYPNKLYEEWKHGLQTKICVGVSSEQDLQSVYDRAKTAGIPCAIITDAGKTEFNGVPTKTACAIGPAAAEDVDRITGSLTLL